MVGVGGVAAMSVGSSATPCATPTTRRSSAREGIFDLSRLAARAVLRGHLRSPLIGLFTMLFGPGIYQPGEQASRSAGDSRKSARRSRRSCSIAGCAAIASNSTLSRAARRTRTPRPTPSRRARATTDRDRGERSLARRNRGDRRATGDTGATARGPTRTRHGTVIAGTADRQVAVRDRVAHAGVAGPGRHGRGWKRHRRSRRR